MEIFINEKNANIILDTEKTLADVLAGLDMWISPTGNRMRSLSIDGTDPGDDLPAFFDKNVNEIKRLDVTICTWSELAIEALSELLGFCSLYERAAYEERQSLVNEWIKSAAARFLDSDINDIGRLALLCFDGNGLSAQELSFLIEERLREVINPFHEISSCETLVQNIVDRMQELPLDVQTGKDRRAAETIQHFSGICEKLFRLYFILNCAGLSPDSFSLDGLPARDFINDFESAIKELITAYENRDIVLAGDIAEYELAPRLSRFYQSLKHINK
jgi:hypothetical protein